MSTGTRRIHDRGGNGSFTMNPDGSINTILLRFRRARMHDELAVTTKALVKDFYG